MSLALLRREVAECRAFERRLAAGSAETRAHAAMPGTIDRWLPLAMPIYGAIAMGMGVGGDAEWWVYVIPWWWLLSWGRAFPRTLPTEWEALALPSRRAWLIARLSLRIPMLAWLGACAIAGLLLRGLRDEPAPEELRWGVIASLAMAPGLLALVAAWFPFAERDLGGGMSQVAAFAAVGGVASVAAGGILLAYRTESIGGIVLVGMGAVFAALAAPSFFELVRGPRSAPASIGTRFLRVVRIGFTGVVALGAIVSLLIASIMWKHGLVVPAGDPRSPWASIGLPAFVAVAVLVVGLDLLHRVEAAEVGLDPVPGAAAKPRKVPAPRAPAAARRGSLLAASWAIYRGKWRVAPQPILLFLPRLLWHLRAPVLGCAAAAVGAAAGAAGGWSTLTVGWLAVVVLLFVPFHFDLPASRRLHLLGADWGAVARHNLRTGLAAAALPAVLGACAATLLPLFTPIAGTGAIFFVAGFLAARASTGPLDLVFDPLPDGRAGCLVLSLPLGALVTGSFLAPAPTFLAFGAAVFAIGAATVLRDLRDPEGAGRRLEAGAADD